MAGKPMSRSGKICGAKTRKGTPCQSRALFASGKCKNHGGLSTGPRTAEGKAKSVAAARDALALRRELRELLAGTRRRLNDLLDE